MVKTKAYNLADDETKANVFEMSHAYSKTKAGLLIKQSKGLSGLTFSPTYDKIAENLITLQILNKDEAFLK